MEQEAKKLLDLLDETHVDYVLYEHEPVYTSEQASRVRRVDLRTGVKALVLKKSGWSEFFFLGDIAADRRLDFTKLESILGAKKVRFATRDEVIRVTNCEPGSVHPLGNLYGIETYLDRSVLENEFVNFNIGLLTKSVRISSKDLLRLLGPTKIFNFAKETS